MSVHLSSGSAGRERLNPVMKLITSELISSCKLEGVYTCILDDSASQNKCDGLLCAAYTPACRHSLLPTRRQLVN